MATSEQMELMIKIRAQGQEAAAQLKRIEERMGRIKSAGAAAGAGIKGAFGLIEKGGRLAGRGLHAVLAPLGWMAKGLTAAGAAAAAFGALTVKASGDMEMLRLRLDGVAASAEESKRIFQDVKELGIASPFSDKEMAEAAIALRQFALYSRQNLQTISDTATVAQRDMQEVVMAIVGMEAEPLRRLGIQFSAAGGSFTAQYRTKLGEVKSETAKTRDEASQMLIDIFKTRFGGAAGAFATSWKGVTATLTGALEQGIARVGDGLRKRLAGAVGGLNERLGALIESGRLDAIGERIGAALEDGVDKARAAFETLSVLSEKNSFGTMMAEGAAGAAEIMARGFLEYLRAGYGVIEGIVRAAFGVVLQEYRMSDLPGAAGARERFARDTLASMRPEDALRHGIPERFAGKQDTMMSPERRAQLNRDIGQFVERSAADRAPWLRQAAAESAGATFTAGVKSSIEAIAEAGPRLKEIVGEVSRRRLENVERTTGYDVTAMYEANLERIRAGKTKPEPVQIEAPVQRVRAAWPLRDTAGNVQEAGAREAVFEGSGYKRGQRLPSGAIVVNVQNLTVRANSPQELKERILNLSQQPVAMAGAY